MDSLGSARAPVVPAGLPNDLGSNTPIKNGKSRDECPREISVRLNKGDGLSRFETKSLILSWVTLIVLVITFLVFLFQLLESKTQTAIFRNQAKQAAADVTAQISIAQQALIDSRKAFRVDQRPYLVAETPQFLIKPPSDMNLVSVNVTVKNIGKTPAIKVSWYVNLQRYRGSKNGTAKLFTFYEDSFADLRKKAAIDERGKYVALIRRDVAPSAPFFTTANISALSTQERKELVTGELTLFYVGLAKYTDASHESYETEFCYYYFGSDPAIWHICDTHNTIK